MVGDTEDGPYAWFVRPMALRPEVVDFQAGVADWARKCFERPLYRNMTERGDRLLEEVLELLQSKGYDSARVRTLVDYVYARPVGEPAQEVGGVMVTLAVFCSVAGLDMKSAGGAELARIAQPEVMEKIRAKQELKNALHFDTPLPGDAGRAATGKQSLQVGEVQGDAHVPVLRALRAILNESGRYSPARTAALDAAIAALAARQPAGEATWGVLTIGNEGAFYDPKGTRRAFTYARQPGNILASNLGRAVISAANASAGDSIDRGLALLKSLQEHGFGVFQIGECAGPPAQAVDLGQFRECVELMEWQERGHDHPDFPVGDPKKHAEALRLLALIDGQAEVSRG